MLTLVLALKNADFENWEDKAAKICDIRCVFWMLDGILVTEGEDDESNEGESEGEGEREGKLILEE